MIRQPHSCDVHQALVDFARAGRACALCTILSASGSTPRKIGTKALVDATGAVWGTIGGGAVEAKAQELAVQAIASGQPIVFDCALDGDQAGHGTAICGGTVRILVDPTAAKHQEAYDQARQARRQRRPGVLLTMLHAQPGLGVTARWLDQQSLGDDASFPGNQAIGAALAENVPRLLAGDQPRPDGCTDVLIEPLIPPPLLLIAGGGHIGQALAVQADLVGFQVVVVDDRSEFCLSSLYPDSTDIRCGDIAHEVARFPIAADTYIAIVTRGHAHDMQALRACIASPAAYIGMIGSRRKVSMIFQELLAGGLANQEQINCVYAPIGLDIGAQTVPEIATSIVAQLIAVRRKGVAPRFLDSLDGL